MKTGLDNTRTSANIIAPAPEHMAVCEAGSGAVGEAVGEAAGAGLASRRAWLLTGLSWGVAALGGCGGGGGSSAPAPGPVAPTPPAPPAPTPPPAPPPPAPPPPASATGTLVYRSSTGVGLYSLGSRTERSFEPSSRPFLDPGVAVSPQGLVTAALDASAGTDFQLGFYSLAGAVDRVLGVKRDATFQTSAVVFNASGTRLAFSVDEPVSASNTTRIARTLVVAWPAAQVLAEFDRLEEPVWAGDELLLRDPATQRLRLVSASLVDQGLLGSVVVDNRIGSYNASADGRVLVWQDANNPLRVNAWDRSSGLSWLAAQDSVSDLRSPVLSPDGRFLAVLTRGVFFDTPHVLPFAAGSTVQVDSAVHELANAMVNANGRIGWAA